MGFLKKIGNAVAKGVNSVAGTNLSVGSSGGGGSSSVLEDKLVAVVENGVVKLVNAGLKEGEKALDKQVDKLLGGNSSTSGGGLAETLGKFGSKILGVTTTEWLKKNWWLLLIPIPLALIIYFLISGGKKTKKKWY